jgi:hypothetical protein
LAFPPVPVQVSVNVVVALKAPVDTLPLVALVPFQPPDAAQLVALVELQTSVEEPPLGMVAGVAVNVTVGAGTTVTITVSLALPPVPVHVRVKLVVVDKGPIEAVPPVGLLPLHPPDAAQVVASIEFHVRDTMPPTATLVGLADSVTVGAGTTVTATVRTALPPVPVQVRVNEAVAVNAPVETDPLVACDPLQPPDARQLVASVEVQVSIAEPPLATLVGLAPSVTVGGVAVDVRCSPAAQAQRLAPTTRAMAAAHLRKAGEAGDTGVIWRPSNGRAWAMVR